MAGKIVKTGRQQQKIDLEETWNSKNPIILKGEVCVAVNDDGIVGIKIADADKYWNDVPYWPADPIPATDTLWKHDGGDYSVMTKAPGNSIEAGVSGSSIIAGNGITATESNTAYAQNMVITNNLVLPEWTDSSTGITYPAVNLRSLDKSDWDITDETKGGFIKNKPFQTIDGVTIINDNGVLKASHSSQVQANYGQNTATAVDYIKNRPTISAAFSPRQEKEYALLLTDTNIFSSSKTSDVFTGASTLYNYYRTDNYYLTVDAIFAGGNPTVTLKIGEGDNSTEGKLLLEGSKNTKTILQTNSNAETGSTYNIQFPAKSGTVALTSDIPEAPKPYVKNITSKDLKLISGNTTDSDEITLLSKISGNDYSEDDDYYVITVEQTEHKKEIVGGLLLLDADGNYVLADMNINKSNQSVTVLVQSSFSGTLIIS